VRWFCLVVSHLFMNLPNRLTLARLGLTVLFVISLSFSWGYGATLALGLFIIASITDWLDGDIARKQNLVTDFGALMDPLVDKIMTAAAFVMLVDRGVLPAWAVVIIVSREFLITGLRMLAGAKGVVLPAEKLGKHKTAWQIVSIVYFLGLLSLHEWVKTGFAQPWQSISQWCGNAILAFTVVLTLWSGLAYLAKNRRLIASQ